MLQTVWDQIQTLLGLGQDVGDVGAVQMALRTSVIYAFSLVIVRLGSKRFLSEATAFDVVVGIMLGSVMSRAINGSAPFSPTLLGGVALVGIHWLLGALAVHASWFGTLVKGSPVLLIKDGEIQREGMRRTGLSNNDLEQALRLRSNQTDPTQVQLAYLERNGGISVIPRKREPCIVDVSVVDGVQTVRIALE
jgi:uncharacterized membrane protein YcaP (DUF421 family)